MPNVVDSLVEIYPLPTGWKTPEVHASHVVVGGTKLERVGLVSFADDGMMVTGSAVELASIPVRRAYFELLERLSIVEAEKNPKEKYPLLDQTGKRIGEVTHSIAFPASPAPDQWRYARSNGVAAHGTFEEAQLAARRELIERDAVLRSWYGECTPAAVAIPKEILDEGLCSAYSFEAYQFATQCADTIVTAVFAFPKIVNKNRAYGFGARSSRSESIENAMRECMQALGFLFEEGFSKNEPDFSPSPAYHLEYYLRPEGTQRIRSWLEGAHRKYFKRSYPAMNFEEVGYVDLTPENLRGKMCVVKAIDPTFIPLVFGACDQFAPKDFPVKLRIHPIA